MKKILLFLGCSVFLPVIACTTFATFKTESGNLMMAKNRDNRPDHQIVEVVNASGRYKYLALSRLDVKDFVSAGINGLMGYFLVKKGRSSHSPALVADGKHLRLDAYNGILVVAALALTYFTHWYWVDSVASFLFAGFMC